MPSSSIFCVLCLSLPSAASGATAPEAHVGNASAQPVKATASPPAPKLFGDQAIESGHGSKGAGLAEAVPFRSYASGTLTAIRVFIDRRNTAKAVAAGIYTTIQGHPGRRIASGSLSRPKAGKWNRVAVGSTRITDHRTYWIAVLGRRGRLAFRDRSRGSCTSEGSHQTRLKSLPSSWKPGRRSHTCPISAYAMGHRSGAGAPRTKGAPGTKGTPPTPGSGTPGGPPPPPPQASSVSCALTAAAESCWASHTGVPGYTEAPILAGQSPLRHVIGDITVTTAGAVISNEWIDGCVAIDANNVTIKDSLIHTRDQCNGGNGRTAASAVNDGNGSSPTGLVIQDTEVDGMDSVGDAYGVSGDNFTCLRCNVHGFSKNVSAGNAVLIQDSYSHDLSTNAECSHSSTVYADSATNVTLEHSYLRATGTSDGCISAAFMNGGSYGAPSDDTVDNSYLEGVTGADMQEGCGSTNVHVTNNAFSGDNGYNGTDYVYGFDGRNAGNVWSGNYVPELSKVPAPPPRGNPGTGNC